MQFSDELKPMETTLSILAIITLAFILALQIPHPLQPIPSHDEAPGLILNNVTVVSPGLENMTQQQLTIIGNTINRIEKAQHNTGEFSGMFVLPGLTDMHVHLPTSQIPGQEELFAFLYLYHGVTAIRDVGDMTGGHVVKAMKQAFHENRYPGPRIFGCGPFVDGDPPLFPNSVQVTTLQQAREAVLAIKDNGFDCIKVYNELDQAPLDALIQEANDHQLTVVGHVPRRLSFENVKIDDIQHSFGLGPKPQSELPLPPNNFKNWQQMNDLRRQQLIDHALANDISLTPTLAPLKRKVDQHSYQKLREQESSHYLPDLYRDVLWHPDGGMISLWRVPEKDREQYPIIWQELSKTLLAMHQAGVEIHSGTDTPAEFNVPGKALQEELQLFVDIGLSPEEALQISSVTSSQALSPALGVIREGRLADLVIYKEDPTRNVDALKSIAAVIVNGRLYRRADLDQQLNRYIEHHQSLSYQLTSNTLTKATIKMMTLFR